MTTPGIKNWQLIHCKWFYMQGITLFPFVIYQHPGLLSKPSFINHEHIHLRQQRELLVIPFYVIYLLHYLFNLIKYRRHHKAYLNIVFEREAYTHENTPNYLQSRKWMAWMIYWK